MPNTQSNMKNVYKIAEACNDLKGLDLKVLNVKDVFSLSDYFMIVSGRSDRHTQGIANRILEDAKEIGLKPTTIEGYDKAHWILIDFGSIIVHVFYQPTREHYKLEELWVNAKEVELPQTSTSDLEAA